MGKSGQQAGPSGWTGSKQASPAQCSPLSVAVFSRILGQRQPRRMRMADGEWRWGVPVPVPVPARNLEIGWIEIQGV